jgi:hypothetical protein
MILPDDDLCRKCVEQLDRDPALSLWERGFLADNRGRLFFTDKQKEVFAGLLQKFEVKR